jgi:regulator of protease activity HflC (stomatin/prohibitin superfamily)
MRTLIAAVVAGLVLLLASCMSVVYVNPGSVGVVIHKAGGGVDATPLGPGFHLRNPVATQIEEYPVSMQTLVLTKSSKEGTIDNDEINVNSKEGQPLAIDVSLSFDLDPTLTPHLYSTFRQDIETITHSYVKQTIRQALQETVGSELVADVIGPKKAETATRTQALVTQRLAAYGIVSRQFTINELRAPQSVIEAINAKNVMQQQALTAQNELQKNQFQAQGDSIKAAGRAKAILAEAEAKAKAAKLLAAGSSESYMRVLALENEKAAIEKWDGALPTMMNGNGVVPFLDVTKAKGKP